MFASCGERVRGGWYHTPTLNDGGGSTRDKVTPSTTERAATPPTCHLNAPAFTHTPQTQTQTCINNDVRSLVLLWAKTINDSKKSLWGRDFASVQTGPGAHPASRTMGTGSFPKVKSGPAVTLTPHPLLVSWSRKGRALPLLPVWAVRPVQSLSVCTKVHLTFTFTFTCKRMHSMYIFIWFNL